MFAQYSFWQFVFSLLAIAALWSFSLLLAGLGIAGNFSGPTSLNDVSLFLLSAATGFSGLLLIPSAALSLLRLLGKPVPQTGFPTGRFLRPTFVILLLPVVLLAGYLVVEKTSLAWLLLPPLHVLAVGLPVLWVVLLAVKGLPLGSAQRRWGVLAGGLVLGPGISLFLEGAAMVAFVLIGILYASSQPRLLEELTNLGQRLQYSGGSPEVALQLIVPYLVRPAVLLSILTFLSIIAPLIEEAVKPVGVWLLAGFRLTPAAGFAAGALSGSGFALFESLAMTVSAEDWVYSVVVRISTAVVHIVLTALSGWALATAWQKGRYLVLAGVYLGVVAFHALWNGLTLATAVASLPGVNLETSPFPWLSQLGGDFGVYFLGVMAFLALFVLLWMNWNLRNRLATGESML